VGRGGGGTGRYGRGFLDGGSVGGGVDSGDGG
jgi:hypothetical protein